MPTLAELAPPLPLALATCLVAIAVVAYAVRAHGRRQRREARRTTVSLADAFAGFLDDRLTRRELAAKARAAGEASFWTALEGFASRLDRAAWLRLSTALERNPHAAVERRALRDDSPWRRVLAAKRLGLVRADAARRALRRAMARGPEIVTLAAAQSLGRFRDRAALRWLMEHPAALARRPHHALVALFVGYGRSGLTVLMECLERRSSPHAIERAMVETLGRGRDRARPGHAAIERRLRARELDLRVAAARALGEMGAAESAEPLIAALDDPAWPVRAQAARALGRVRASAAVDPLTGRLCDPSWWVRRHAAYALAALGEPGHAALLRTVASSPDPYARNMAREVLDVGPRLDTA
jgi:HEAT repeat protein